MRVPITGSFRWTAPFEEKRPLSAPLNKRDHIHGAEDIAPNQKAEIVAPEDGTAYFFCAIRPDTKRSMNEVQQEKWPFNFKGRSYFYDLYGGVIIFISKDRQRTHIMTHSYRNQLFNQTGVNLTIEESKADERFPICVEHSFYDPKTYDEGQKICGVGNAGYSTGVHIHWEIHYGTEWNEYSERIKPRQWSVGE
jgi:hypothetical protein